MKKQYLNKLRKLGACKEAIDWASTQETPAKAWATCERGDWMAWWCGEQAGRPWSVARKKLVLAVCECARLALPYARTGDLGSLKTIETAEGWAHGKATREEVMDAAAVYDSVSAASASAACSASVSNASYASYTAWAAVYAAGYAASDAEERKKVLKECADIVRKYYPKPPGGRGKR